jgi:hypothetical protein
MMSPRFVFVGIGVRVMVFNATFKKFIRYIVGVSFIAFCSGLGLWYFTPLSTNIYRCGQFYYILFRVMVMVFSATLANIQILLWRSVHCILIRVMGLWCLTPLSTHISVISWRSVLLLFDQG